MLQAAVHGWRGATPEAFAGVTTGSFIGLLCLALEFALVERSARTMHQDGSQAILATFTLRVFVVGILTLWLGTTLWADATAFAVSFCNTFFVYLGWLTWRIGVAPSAYAAIQQEKARELDRIEREAIDEEYAERLAASAKGVEGARR